MLPPMTTIDNKGREFEIMHYVAELLDTLDADQQRQALAMLAVRYGMQLKDPPAARPGSGYGPRKYPKKKYAS